MTRRLPLLALPLALLLTALPVLAQRHRRHSPSPTHPAAHLTTPEEFFGFNIGDDWQEASYSQAVAYWKKLATETNCMKLVDIGPTEEGRQMWMAVISSPENMRKLDYYRNLNVRLARGEVSNAAEAQTLANQGKAVVWIDGGVHATETVGFEQLIQQVYVMVSDNGAEMQRIRRDDIALIVPMNPDGEQEVADWWNRIPTPDQRTMAPGLPTLFNKYIGHDDNRDSYMSNMKETADFNRQMFEVWFPEIIYDHHQAGPAGTVIFMPPFRDPFNYNFDPLIPLDIEELGAAMHANLVAHGMGGSVQRKGAPYSTWWDGGIRTESYFHNIIGLLTEVIGEPNPTQIPLVPKFQLPSSDWPLPIVPQLWHYRQSIAYAMQNNRAVLDYASRNRSLLLYDIWVMAHGQIQQGSQDSWTITPNRIAALEAAAKQPGGMVSTPSPYGFMRRSINPELYTTVLHNPAYRDPRGYIIPSDQHDFATATKFVNALIKNGTEIERATSDFTVNGQSFPAGSYVVMTAQADRPYVLDMFEPQNYPNDLAYPGGPPVPPYDTAGWTLADQMGVQFTRELDAFSGPLQQLPFGQLQPMPSYAVSGAANPAGYLISHRIDNAFILINRLMQAGDAVYWMQTPQTGAQGQDLGTGAIYVPAAPGVKALVESAGRQLGVRAEGLAGPPAGSALQLHPIRIGLYDQYGGSMPSGWVRWMFDQYEFPYQRVWPQELAAGNLNAKFDVLVFVDSGLPRRGGRGFLFRRPQPTAAELATVPEKYRLRMGSIGPEDVAPLKAFVQAGGTLLTIGSGSSLAQAVGLPITSALVEMGRNGHMQPLPNQKFYIPGSLLRMSLDNHDPIAYGMGSYVDVDFDHDPVFHTVPNATLDPAVAGWFSGGHTLVSGWANGEGYLNGTAAIVAGRIGLGMVYAIGPEVTFRAQPHASFKLLFNGLYAGTATPAAAVH
ncbi:MAG: M14 family metallopeptidase [Terriglobales bacterium]